MENAAEAAPVEQQQEAPALEVVQEPSVYDVPEDTTDHSGDITGLGGGKFKSVDELDKAYSELQKQFSSTRGVFTGAPEVYKNGEDPVEGGMLADIAKELNMSQEGFDKVNQLMAERQEAEQKDYYEAELNKLGENHAQRLSALEQWGKDKGVDIAPLLGSASNVEALEKIMETSVRGVAPTQASAAPQALSAEEIRDMQLATDQYGQPKMNDPAYAQKVMAMIERRQKADGRFKASI